MPARARNPGAAHRLGSSAWSVPLAVQAGEPWYQAVPEFRECVLFDLPDAFGAEAEPLTDLDRFSALPPEPKRARTISRSRSVKRERSLWSWLPSPPRAQHLRAVTRAGEKLAQLARSCARLRLARW